MKVVTLATTGLYAESFIPSSSTMDLIGYQNTAMTTTSTTDVLMVGSDIQWESEFTGGKSVFLEGFIISSATTLTASVSLYTAAGVIVSGATISTTTAGARVRTTALALVGGTTYQLRWKISAAGTASLKLIRLVVI